MCPLRRGIFRLFFIQTVGLQNYDCGGLVVKQVKDLMSESALIDGCLRLLRLHGAFAWRNNSGTTVYGRPGQRRRFVRYGLPGSADILAVLNGGRFAAIEVKRGTTVVTDRQLQFLSEVQSRGGLAMVVRDPAELEAELKRQRPPDTLSVASRLPQTGDRLGNVVG